MAEEKLLTVRDVSLILEISEKEVLDLVDNGAIPAYKVGGVYLRFKREQVDTFKKSLKISKDTKTKAGGYSLGEKFSDFFYFNDFYILTIMLILLILVIIFQGY